MTERRKHEARDCAWGSTITEIKTTLDILVGQIKLDNAHREKVDGEQYDLLRMHTGDIAGLQANVGNLDKRINNIKPVAAAPVVATAPATNCPEPSLWQLIRKIKKYWPLFLLIGGGTLFALFADILINIGTWLNQLVSTGGVP